MLRLETWTWIPLAAHPVAQQKGSAGGKDTVVLKDGKTETGRVENEDYAGVTLKGVTPLPWENVVSVTYAGEGAFDAAYQALSEGKNAEALAAFQALLTKGQLRQPIQQQVQFYVPVLKQRMGDLDGAIAGFHELVDAFPKGRFLQAASDNILGLYAARKDYAGAEKALEKVANATAGLREFQAEIALKKGRLLEIQKDFTRADVSYDFAERGATKPAVVQEAKLGRARCLAGNGRRADAEAAFKKLVQDGTTNAILAGAWNGLGDVAAEEGKTKRDTQKLMSALYAYLRGVVQYAPLPGEPTLEYEHSLSGAARCFKLISELETSDEKRRLYADRARAHGDQLRSEFPNSIYLEGI